jgi:hypothetical protein
VSVLSMIYLCVECFSTALEEWLAAKTRCGIDKNREYLFLTKSS